MSYLYADITEKIWRAIRSVQPEFSRHPGLSEREKCKALAQALVQQGLSVATQVPVIHRNKGKPVGVGKMDLLVDGRVIIEVKNTQATHARHIEQLDLYLKDSGLALGVLINFGIPNLNLDNPEHRQLVYTRRYYAVNDPTKVMKG
jgi:GxxExxY protein